MKANKMISALLIGTLICGPVFSAEVDTELAAAMEKQKTDSIAANSGWTMGVVFATCGYFAFAFARAQGANGGGAERTGTFLSIMGAVSIALGFWGQINANAAQSEVNRILADNE